MYENGAALKNCFYYVQRDFTPGILIRKHIIADTKHLSVAPAA